jgi:hypothetical protein
VHARIGLSRINCAQESPTLSVPVDRGDDNDQRDENDVD